MLTRIITAHIIVAAFNLLTISESHGINNELKTGSKPDWVTAINPDTIISNLKPDTFGGYYYLLLDIQENIAKETMFCHYALKLFNSEGVQNMSDISVDFDPGFQTLIFHEINRYRNGIKTNELLNHKIKIIQREPEMERFLYDGRLTAFVNLEDIREGDIIEYSYSLKGYNPIYQKNYFGSFNLEYTDPVKEICRRIITPQDKKLFFSYPSGKAEPAMRSLDGNLEYSWRLRDVKSHIYDNNVPAWYNNTLRVEISTLDSWSSVSKLCIINYQVSEAELSHLKSMADELFIHTDKDSLLIRIVRFVQDEVRYLGFESGLNAYKPILPCKVMELRYADCKAKSLLLCNLLRLYGMEAYPVLVNSNLIKDESIVFKSPDVFNHCIVQINCGQQLVYIDPTIAGQGGIITDSYFPDYGYGLVLREGVSDLIRLTNNCKSETRVKNYFKTDTIDGPVSYKVITEYSGFYADDIRSSFRNNSDDETTKSYLKFYSKTYPMIRPASPLKYIDDRNRNLFSVQEEYLIDSMWIPDDKEPKKLELTLAALIINSAAGIPSSPERTMPYLISFPSEYTEDTYIELPVDLELKASVMEIQDSVFSFSYSKSYKDRKAHLHYKYATHRNYQSAKTFKEFYSRHKKITDNLYYTITYTPNSSIPFRFSWTIAFCSLFLLVVSCVFAVIIYHNFNLQIDTSENRVIGGWLVLIAFGLIVSTYKVANNLFFSTNFFELKTWTIYLLPGSINIPLFLLICFEFLYNNVLLVYLVLLQVLFYKRRNIVPRLLIVFLATNMIVLLFDTLLAFALSPDSYTDSQKNKSYLEIGRTLVYSIIWIAYFINSKRVKATFTRVSDLTAESIPVPVIDSESNQTLEPIIKL